MLIVYVVFSIDGGCSTLCMTECGPSSALRSKLCLSASILEQSIVPSVATERGKSSESSEGIVPLEGRCIVSCAWGAKLRGRRDGDARRRVGAGVLR